MLFLKKKDFIGINYFLINGGDVTKLSIKRKTWLSKKRKKERVNVTSLKLLIQKYIFCFVISWRRSLTSLIYAVAAVWRKLDPRDDLKKIPILFFKSNFADYKALNRLQFWTESRNPFWNCFHFCSEELNLLGSILIPQECLCWMFLKHTRF